MIWPLLQLQETVLIWDSQCTVEWLCIVELDQFGTRDIHKTMLHGEFLAPHRPAFVENRVREKAAQAAGVLELNDKLQVMPRIGFVNRGEFQAMVLTDFGEFFLRMLLVQTQIVHPKDAGLVA